MVRASEQRGAADELVDQYADYDDEFEYHQALVADETFGTLALVKTQLAIQDKYGDLEDDVDAHAAEAAEEIDAALDARAEQVRAEVDDGHE